MAEFVADCPRCGSQAVTFDVLGDSIANTRRHFPIFEALSTCRHCGQSSIAQFTLQAGTTSARFSKPGALTALPGSVLTAFNLHNFVSAKDAEGMPAPEHLPPEVEQCFREGAACYAIGCHNAAAAMFRLCLDMATKGLLPMEDGASGGPNRDQRKKLANRLAWLFEVGKLPPGLEDLADCVREDGNDGAHDGTLTPEDAADLIDFTTALLERVYTEPARLELAKARRIERRS